MAEPESVAMDWHLCDGEVWVSAADLTTYLLRLAPKWRGGTGQEILIRLAEMFSAEAQELRPTARETRTGRPRTAECGTQSGYARHLLDHTPTCDPCKEAHRVYQAERAEKRGSEKA